VRKEWDIGKSGTSKIPTIDTDATEPPILRKLDLNERQWHQQMLGSETNIGERSARLGR
jgi:hypothetical protein